MKSISDIRHLAVGAIAACALCAACGEVPVVDVETPSDNSLQESLINANRYMAGSEETRIDAYVGRRGWTMQRLAGGARVMVVEKGGAAVAGGDTVAIVYSVEGIGGDTLYAETTDTVVAGRLLPTRGLDAALLTLGHGGHAKVIVPSEQAYGLVGDGDRIGPRATLVYDLKVK